MSSDLALVLGFVGTIVIIGLIAVWVDRDSKCQFRAHREEIGNLDQHETVELRDRTT